MRAKNESGERLERGLNLLGISDGVGVACECCPELPSYKSRSGYFSSASTAWRRRKSYCKFFAYGVEEKETKDKTGEKEEETKEETKEELLYKSCLRYF